VKASAEGGEKSVKKEKTSADAPGNVKANSDDPDEK